MRAFKMIQILKKYVLQIFDLPFNKVYFNTENFTHFKIWSLNMLGV